ncbi:MAG: CapA family protein [Acidimicrobiia bacterium]|nr:CapA family protein [Acidimicrobiia bacterium]
MQHVGGPTGRWVLPLASALLLLVAVAAFGDPIPESDATADGDARQSPATTADPAPQSATTSTGGSSSTSSTVVSTAPAEPPPLRRPITLGFAGDTSFTNGLHSRNPFAEVTDLLSAPDLMVINLETAVADPDVGRVFVDKDYLFRSPPAALDLVVDAGIDAVVLANNHTLDFGPEALAQTLQEVDRVGLHRVGAGLTAEEAYQPLILEVGDWTIGLVGLSRVPCDWSASGENTRPWVAWACPSLIDRADAMVVAAVEAADVVVVMVHGGTEGVLCPSPHMVELEQRWASLGADVVVDGHPHVLQGITSWGDTIVVHSAGNFAFPSARGITANSAVFLVEVSEDGIDLRVEPVRVDGGVVRRPTADQHQAIRDQINSVSSGWQLDETGRAVRTDEAGAC